MNNFVMKTTLAILSLGLAAGVQAAGDAAAGKTEFEVCAVCHGANGEGAAELNVPRIGGQEEWYVARQLQNFRDGLRAPNTKDMYGTQMRAISFSLDDEQAIANVAAYVASLSPPAPAATVKGDAAKGEPGYATCVACHGAKGEGNPALNSPALAGQNDWYVQRQLKNYNAGIRGTDPKNVFDTQMRPMAMLLTTDEAINNVVAYINSL